jgi:hypothetical protein
MLLTAPGIALHRGVTVAVVDDPIAISDWEAAWAQVSILLDLGNVDAATAAAKRASELGNWDDMFGDAVNIGSPQIFGTPLLPSGWLWVEPPLRRTLLSESTMARFAMRVSMYRFARARQHRPGWHRFDEAAWKAVDVKLRRRFGR